MTQSESAGRRVSSRQLAGMFVAAALAFGVSAQAHASEGGEELSMEEIVEIVTAKNLGTVYEVERERSRYEVKLRDAEGVEIKLILDAVTGEILHEERDDDRESDDDEE